MNFLWDGVRQAWHLIVSGNPYLWKVTWVTLKVAGVSTAVSLVIGLPIGLTLGLGKFRGRRVAVALANFGLVIPPVVVGLVLAILLKGELFFRRILGLEPEPTPERIETEVQSAVTNFLTAYAPK